MNQIEPDGTVLSLGFVKMALFRCRVVKVIRRNKIIFRIMISVSTVITLNRSARLSHDYILSNKDTISFMLKTRKYYSITVLVVKKP